MKRLILLAAFLAVSTGLALPATAGASTARVPGAMAASASAHRLPIARRNTTYHVCLASSTGYCWHFSGVGSQVTITGTSGDYTSMLVLNGGNGYIEFQNAGGNCGYVSANSGQPWLETSGGCSGTAGELIAPGSTGYLQSYKYPIDRLMTFNTGGGKPVWTNDQSGWAKWVCIANGLQYEC